MKIKVFVDATADLRKAGRVCRKFSLYTTDLTIGNTHLSCEVLESGIVLCMSIACIEAHEVLLYTRAYTIKHAIISLDRLGAPRYIRQAFVEKAPDLGRLVR